MLKNLCLGAGGKGGPSRTFAIDRDACKHYITASTHSTTVKKFLLVSYIASRHSRPSWWIDEDWDAAQNVNQNVLKTYFEAKVDADEYLLSAGKCARESGKEDFLDICLRPGTLTDEGEGNVLLGRTGSRGEVSRVDVARVAAELLETGYRGWLDLLKGDDGVEDAVKKVVGERVDCVEGEDLEKIYASHKVE